MDSVAIPNFEQNICVKRRTQKELWGGGGLVRELYLPTSGGGVSEDDRARGARTFSSYFRGKSERRTKWHRQLYPSTPKDDGARGSENCIRPLPGRVWEKTTENVAQRTVSAHFRGRNERRRRSTWRRELYPPISRGGVRKDDITWLRELYPLTSGGGMRKDEGARGARTVSAHFRGRSEKRRRSTWRILELFTPTSGGGMRSRLLSHML